MNRDRHTLLQLVAAGRLSAAEAERLMAAWNRNREDAWIFFACLLMLVLPHQAPLHALLGAARASSAHLARGLASMGPLFSKLHHLTGGSL